MSIFNINTSKKSGIFNKCDISEIINEKSPEILQSIRSSKHILLHCHPSPDPDSVCSVLAMKFVLEAMGKKVTAIKGDSNIPHAFSHFPGVDTITAKNFFELNLADYDLFISLDSGSPNMISGYKPIVFPDTLKVIVIDHHASNNGYGKINLIDTSSPATAFVIFQLFKIWDIELTHDIAVNLFMGMYTDTGGFKFPPTDYKVLEACMECVKIAPDFTRNIFLMENNERPQSIYFQAMALSSITNHLNNNLVISMVDYVSMQSKNIELEDIQISNVSNVLKSVIGWNVAVSMVEVAPNSIKVSLRTRDPEKFNVSRLAVALGGGGHVAAAGIRINGVSIDEARDMIVNKAKEIYNL